MILPAAHLDQYGPTQFAFTFKTMVQPDEQFQQTIDWSSFEPCPAVYIGPAA